MGAADRFAKLADARASQGGNYVKDGSYVLCVTNAKFEEGFEGAVWVTEFKVLESRAMPDVYEAGGEPCAPGTANAVLVKPIPVGGEFSFVRPMKIQNSAGDVKSFMLALTGTKSEDYNRDEFIKACDVVSGPEQKARGFVIRSTTFRKANQGRTNTANRGKLLVLQKWDSLPNVPAEFQARREAIEKGLPVPWTPIGGVAQAAA